jgi:hypothetical protein
MKPDQCKLIPHGICVYLPDAGVTGEVHAWQQQSNGSMQQLKIKDLKLVVSFRIFSFRQRISPGAQ